MDKKKSKISRNDIFELAVASTMLPRKEVVDMLVSEVLQYIDLPRSICLWRIVDNRFIEVTGYAGSMRDYNDCARILQKMNILPIVALVFPKMRKDLESIGFLFLENQDTKIVMAKQVPL